MTWRMVVTLVGLAGFLGAATMAAPDAGGAASESVTVAIDPVRQPVACPGRLEIPVGTIQSGDADLDSGSTDVEFAIAPAGQPVGGGFAVDADQAASVERVGSGDIAGLAAVSCARPAQDQWLVGGSTALGASARLVLTNPTDASVRARIEVYGPVGASDEAPSILLGPGTQETILLEAIAPELPAVAVHVSAEGVGVAAALQDSRLDGFTAAGTDWVSPSTPADSVVVPVAGPSAEGASATLSLLAPDGAQATLTLLTETGPQAWLGDETLDLEPGVLTEVQLPEVGLAAVRVDASGPVVAGARVLVPREAPLDPTAQAFDHGWTAAQNVEETAQRTAVVPDGDVSLVVAAPAAGTFTADAGGAQISAAVPQGGGVVSQPLDLAPGTVLSSAHPLAWALVVTDDDAGFVTTVEPTSTELPSLEVEVAVGSYTAVP